MARVLPRVLMLASLWLVAPTVRAESHNPADYPLRIHIYRRSETTFYHNRQAEEAKGEGRANLFESGQPKGVDFQFECDTKLQTSSGYETCRLKVLIKDFVYVSRNGTLNSEPVDVFKQWMVKHDYDPEHGKNSPTQTTPAATKPTDPAPPIGSPQAPESITPPQ
jgi:hypothetical protein